MKKYFTCLFILLSCCLLTACNSESSTPSERTTLQPGSEKESQAELERRYHRAVERLENEEELLADLQEQRAAMVEGFQTDPELRRLVQIATRYELEIAKLKEKRIEIPSELLKKHTESEKASIDYGVNKLLPLDKKILTQKKRLKEAQKHRDFSALKAFGVNFSQ